MRRMVRSAWLLLLCAALGCDERKPAAPGAPAASAAVRAGAPSVAPSPAVAPSASVTRDVAPSAPPPPIGAPKRAGRVGKAPPAPVVPGCFGPIAPGGDGPALTRLASGTIVAVKPNRGGSSVTLRVRFDDGARALFKPEQKRWRVGHRAEIAAYHLDRRLCFLRTAPVAGRRIDAQLLRRHLEASGADPAFLARFDDEVIVRDGTVDGALVAWHTKTLVDAAPPGDWLGDAGAPDATAGRLPEWSDMMVFDYVIDNTDRWSGGNILALGKGGPLIFLDNAAGFTPWRRDKTLDERLAPLCRFRAATVAALRAVGPAATPARRLSALLADSLAGDALAPVIGQTQLSATDARLAALLDHVQRCIDTQGKDRVLSL